MKKIESNFAILDVMQGRKNLEKLIKRGQEIPVTITGIIYDVRNDDGISTEFGVEVENVEVKNENIRSNKNT